MVKVVRKYYNIPIILKLKEKYIEINVKKMENIKHITMIMDTHIKYLILLMVKKMEN
jgi:hypothetical protein